MTTYDNPLHMMETVGGNNARKLAEFYRSGDPAMQARIREAFRDIFETYERQFAAWRALAGKVTHG